MSKIVQLGNTSLQAIYDKYGDFSKMEELNPNRFFDEFHLFTIYGGQGNNLRLKNKVTVHEFNAPRHRLLKILAFAFHLAGIVARLCVFVRKHKIDVIHSKEPLICGVVALAVSKLKRVPFCVCIHADSDQRHK